jgi:hypothetical protein
MKQPTKRLAAALAVASGLAMSSAVQAQTVTTISDFQNFNLTFTYANWDVNGSMPINGGSGFTPIITSGSTPGSFEVQAQGYGSGAFVLPTAMNVPGATDVQLTFTLNPSMAAGLAVNNFMGPTFDLTDGTHQVTYFEYAHYAGPGTFTVDAPLGTLNPADITAFNLEMDPAGYGGGSPYDITYDSLVLVTPAPEPTTLALLGIGAAGLVILRRRARVS